MAELEDAKIDLARHQEALEIVSAFAGQLHEHMQTRTDSEGGFKHAPEVEQACGDIAGVYCHRTCCSKQLYLVCPCCHLVRHFSLMICCLLSTVFDLGDTSGGFTDVYRALPCGVPCERKSHNSMPFSDHSGSFHG